LYNHRHDASDVPVDPSGHLPAVPASVVPADARAPRPLRRVSGSPVGSCANPPRAAGAIRPAADQGMSASRRRRWNTRGLVLDAGKVVQSLRGRHDPAQLHPFLDDAGAPLPGRERSHPHSARINEPLHSLLPLLAFCVMLAVVLTAIFVLPWGWR
jgi:hypothetical protein